MKFDIAVPPETTYTGYHTYVDVRVEPPSPVRGANPRQSTIHEVEAILRNAADRREGPLSFAEIARRMRARKTRPEVVRAAVADLSRYKLVAVGSQGAMWVVVPEAVWNRPRKSLL